jgi:hypothetical protein
LALNDPSDTDDHQHAEYAAPDGHGGGTGERRGCVLSEHREREQQQQSEQGSDR